MRLTFITTAFILLGFISYSQNDILVQLSLIDKRYDDPVRNAKVTVKLSSGNSIVKTSNHLGLVYFNAPKGEGAEFLIEHSKFDEQKFFRKIPAKPKDDTVFYNFELAYSTIQYIQEMVVSAPGVTVVQYGSKKLHVADYEILPNGEMILLTYPKNLEKGHELLLWDGMKVKSKFVVEDKVEELIHDFRGNPHVVGEKSIYGIHVTDGQIGLSNLDKDYFMKYVAPILDTNQMKLYFSNYSKNYPAFDYFSYDRIDSTYTKILGIQDDLMMELYRSEYKWVDVRTKLWAKNKEIETGIDAEIWVGANYFTQSIYYKELYAPLFHRNDTLFVFDYYKDYLRTFTADGERIDSIRILHHYDPRNSGWESNLIQDRVTGQIYAIFERAGYSYIGWVDTNTGEITEQVEIDDRYVHSIQIYDNHIYYIYRPYESPQKKYLYKERLPYNFGAAKTLKGEMITATP